MENGAQRYMNPFAIRKLKLKICGESRESNAQISRDELAVMMKITLRGQKVTNELILIEQMKTNLDLMSRNDTMRPFCQAIYNLYNEKYESQNN